MDIVVANKKENDQLYYHSCGELCCSGWGATPELRKNNSKIILGTPKNKIIMWSKVPRRPTDTEVIWSEVQSVSPLCLHLLWVCNIRGHDRWIFFLASLLLLPLFLPCDSRPTSYETELWNCGLCMNILWVHVRSEADIKLVCMRAKWLIRPELIPVSVAWSNGCQSIAGLPPALNLLVPIIYTPGWWEALRVKYLGQEHNTTPLARALTQTAQSGINCINPEAIAPPTTLN